jgi:hypothetical protein
MALKKPFLYLKTIVPLVAVCSGIFISVITITPAQSAGHTSEEALNLCMGTGASGEQGLSGDSSNRAGGRCMMKLLGFNRITSVPAAATDKDAAAWGNWVGLGGYSLEQVIQVLRDTSKIKVESKQGKFEIPGSSNSVYLMNNDYTAITSITASSRPFTTIDTGMVYWHLKDAPVQDVSKRLFEERDDCLNPGKINQTLLKELIDGPGEDGDCIPDADWPGGLSEEEQKGYEKVEDEWCPRSDCIADADFPGELTEEEQGSYEKVGDKWCPKPGGGDDDTDTDTDTDTDDDCVPAGQWAVMTAAERAGKTKCPCDPGTSDCPVPCDQLDPADPEYCPDPDPLDPRDTDPADDNDTEVSPYMVLTEVRNVTTDTGFRNWDFSFATVDKSLNLARQHVKSLGNSSPQHDYTTHSATYHSGSCASYNYNADNSRGSCASYNPGYYTCPHSSDRLSGSTCYEQHDRANYTSSPTASPVQVVSAFTTSSTTSDSPHEFIYAKPTDKIQFRNTVQKGWWDVVSGDGTKSPLAKTTYATSDAASDAVDNARGELCTIKTWAVTGPAGVAISRFNATSPDQTNSDTATEFRRASATSGGFDRSNDCAHGRRGWTGTAEQLTAYYPVGDKTYEVRSPHQTVQTSDVGKTIIQGINTFPTYAYTDEFKCANPVTLTASNEASLIPGSPWAHTVSGQHNFGTVCGTAAQRTTSGSYDPAVDAFKTTAVKQGGRGASSARAIIPFNYDLRPVTTGRPAISNSCGEPPRSIDDDATAGCQSDPLGRSEATGWPNYGLVYAGENFSFSNNLIVSPRANPDVSSSDYATYTRKTKYQIVSFALVPTSTIPSGYGTGGTGADSEPCAYYGGTRVNPSLRPCIVLENETDKIYNEPGALAGQPNENLIKAPGNNEINVIVDDLPVGTKLCFAAAVYPADSHGKPDVELTSPEDENNGVAMQSSAVSGKDKWAYGAPYCVTIAKKPNFQVWQGGVYSNSGVTASQSPKRMTPSGDPFVAQTRDNTLTGELQTAANAGRNIFGSWSEWEVVSTSVFGFGSGAVFGYAGTTTGASPNKVSYTANNGLDAPTGSVNICAYSSITLGNGTGNAPCSAAAGVGLSKTNGMNAIILARISERYGSLDPSDPNAQSTINSYRITPKIGAAAKSELEGTGDLTIPPNSVYVYDARGQGKVTINRNIIYDNDDADGTGYSDISRIPQAIIFADELTISSGVTHIDSWIILRGGEEEASASGTLDTCEITPGNANDCSTPLTINGPVYATYINLHRTYGAFPGRQTCYDGYSGNSPASTGAYAGSSFCNSDSPLGGGWKGSVAPAERFILRADTLLWAYSQAQIVPIVVTTHVYEPAPSP